MTDAPGSIARRLVGLVPRLRGRRVMVVGDMIADLYVLCEPARLSREAPVLVTRYQDERLIPGGAANAIQNLAAFGAEVIPVGIIGDDAPGARLVSIFSDLGIETGGLVVDHSQFTTTKTRFMVGEPRRMKQQVLRVDRDPEEGPTPEVLDEVARFVHEHRGEIDAVLLSDYGYGLVSPDLVEIAQQNRTGLVTADSRYKIRSFRGLTLATPNQGEVEESRGGPIRTDEELDEAGHALMKELDSEALIVTRGNLGMSLFRPGVDRVDIKATGNEEVTDVSGAGDTVISVVTLALAAGADVVDAARLANFAAGVVVMKVGAATCSPEELLHAIESWS